MRMSKTWFDISRKHGGNRAVNHIFDEIRLFGVSAKDFAEKLTDIGAVREIELYINSPGGAVFDGLAIYNMLQRHPAEVTVFVDGLAASIASVVAMSGDTVIMPQNALLMMHRPMGLTAGPGNKLQNERSEAQRR